MKNLLDGKKVITFTGNDGIIVGDKIMFENSVYVSLEDYNDEWQHKTNSNFDIIELVVGK